MQLYPEAPQIKTDKQQEGKQTDKKRKKSSFEELSCPKDKEAIVQSSEGKKGK